MMKIQRDVKFLPGLILIIAVCYIPSLSGTFIGDDYPIVKSNPFIRQFQSIAAYLSQEDTYAIDQSGDSSGYYRPLINILYTLDYKMWGLNPSGFRTTNLILHLLTCLILYLVLHAFMGGGMGSFWAVLIFALHPANTESVCWVTARNNIVVTLFSLLSLYFYMKKDSPGHWWAPYLSLFFFFMGLLSKEFALMLLPVFFLYDRIIRTKKNNNSHLFYGYLAFITIVIFYFILRNQGTQSIIPWEGVSDLTRRLYFVPYLIIFNLRIVFIPFGLHNFILPYPEHTIGWEALTGFCGTGLIIWLLWKLKRDRILLFSSLSFFFAIFPTLQVIPTSAASMVSMRWLYFPMVFIVLAGASAFNKILKSKSSRLFSIVLGLFSLYLAIYCYVLNESLWKNEKNFLEQEVLHFKNNFYLPELAMIYHDEGKLELAYELFQTAFQENVEQINVLHYIRYTALMIDMNKPEVAIQYLDKAEKLRPKREDLASIHNNRGVAYYMMGNDSESIKHLLKALIITRDDPILLRNLGTAYARTGAYDEAVSKYREALKFGGDPVSTKKMLGRTYMEMGNYSEALNILEQIPSSAREKDPQISQWTREARRKAVLSD